MYIIGDIGNTEVKICFFSKKKKLKKKLILKTNLISYKYLNSKLSYLLKKKNYIKKIIFSSVVPKTFKKIKFFFNKKIHMKCNELKEINLKNMINIKVNKKQIGSDRLSNALSVIDNKNNYIIIDFGTATTFDIVIRKNYLGGIIAPGVNLSLKTLIDNASLIPDVKLKNVKNILGKNTLSAVRSGFYWGYIGLIESIIKKIIKHTRKKYKIILTGGLSHLFKKELIYKVNIDRDITVKGLLKTLKLI
tara:strand:- start:390 stop:1133 length:744 start_codon:yes stop_codon:yes gene_type:complete